MSQAGAPDVYRNVLKYGILALILSIPSLYISLNLPPLWRDEDAIQEIVAPFTPKGIIHFLPGYCLGGRLIIFAGSIVAGFIGGHGLPRLSISDTPLTDSGICALIVVQHLFLIFSLFCAVITFSNRFSIRFFFALVFALIPWPYVFANCIGTEAFSNPLVYLIVALGWKCLRTTELKKRDGLLFFGLLLAAALTRHVNALLAVCLPIALLPLAGKELIFRSATANLAPRERPFRYAKRFLIFVVVGLSAIGSSLLVQQTMCSMFRVPFRSTFGETFLYRLSYLAELPEKERTVILGRISSGLADPVVTEALGALDRSLNQKEGWEDLFVEERISEILDRSGFHDRQRRAWLTDLKLNRIAAYVMFSGEPNYLELVWASFVVSPFFTQPDLAHSPFGLTDWLLERLSNPRYNRVKDLTSFQHREGYYNDAWQRIRYVHLFKRIPMLEMACVTIAFAVVYCGLTFVGIIRDRVTGAGISYAVAMILVALLISAATCFCTYFQPRLFLPLYSLFQMGMLLVLSLAADLLLARIAAYRMSRKRNVVLGPEESVETFAAPANLKWIGRPKRTSQN
jgi:hypothetical protein